MRKSFAKPPLKNKINELQLNLKKILRKRIIIMFPITTKSKISILILYFL